MGQRAARALELRDGRLRDTGTGWVHDPG
jgi:hypothetical protein